MNPMDDEKAFDDAISADEAEFEKGATKPERITESGGVKRLELHRSSPDTSDPEAAPAKSADEKLLDEARQYLSPKSTTGAFAEGTTKGATLGFADELYGALDADSKMNEKRQRIVDDVDEAKRKGTYDPSLSAPDIPGLTSWQLKRPGQADETVMRVAKSPNDAQGHDAETWKKAYTGARDSLRGDFKTADQEHPVAFGTGEFVGSSAIPLPGVGKARGLAKVAKYATQGAGLGFAGGLGNSDADLTEGHGGGALIDAGAGLAGGAVLGGALGYGASKLDPYLEAKAARNAYKSLDPYMKTLQSNLSEQLGRDASPGEVMAEAERLGKRALSEKIIPEGLVSRWANSEELGNRAFNAREEAGKLKGGFVDMAQDQLTKAGQANPVSMGQLATRIEQEATSAKVAGNQDLARKLLKEARDMRQTIVDRASAGYADPAAQSLQDSEALKTMMQGKVDYAAPLARREAQSTAARLAKEQTERAIESGLGPEDLEQFKAVKGKYGDLAKIAKTAGYGALRDFRNNQVGLGDKLAAQVGAHAASGGAAIPAAIAAGAAHHVINNRGASAFARTLQNAAESNQSLVPTVDSWEQFLHKDEEKP